MTVVKQIEDLLERERKSLRDGHYDALPGFMHEKEELFSQLAEESLNNDELTALNSKVERNAALLEAARRGFGSALNQIGAARSAASPQTYGPNGERDRLGPRAKQVEKRR